MKSIEQVEKELQPVRELFKHNYYKLTRLHKDYWLVSIVIDEETKVDIELPSRNLIFLGLEVPD